MEWSLVNGVLTISGEITHTTESYSDWPWYSQRANITFVKFSNAFFAYGSNAYGMFFNCTNLTSLNLSNLSTLHVINMRYMFYSCNSLTSLDLSSFNTSNVTNMVNMFSDCTNLTSLDLSSFNTSNVTNMSGMFSNCQNLTSLDLSSFNTSSVTNMNSMFRNCRSLTSLNLSNFNTSNVTNMNYMFYYCVGLTSLNLSSFNTSNVTGMASMFSDCRNLTSLNLSSFNTLNVTNMGNMFDYCNSLTSLNLSNFNTSNVTNMNYMFSNCELLTSLDLSSFDTSNVNYMTYMFENCRSLTSLDLSNFDTSDVSSVRNMFHNCEALQNIYISGSWNIEHVVISSNMFLNCNNLPNYVSSVVDKTRANADVGGYLTPVPGTPACAYFDSSNNSLNFIANLHGWRNYDIDGTRTYYVGFDKVSSLTEPVWPSIIEIVNFVYSIAPKITYEWFYGCGNLATINNLQLLDTSNVTNMSDMFYGCTDLTSLDLSHFDTSQVTNMMSMFERCYGLTSLDLSNFDTSKVTNMVAMFRDCQSLISLDLSSFNTSNVTSMYCMFSDCVKLTSILWSNDNDKYKKTQDSTIDYTKNYYIFSAIDDKFKKVDNPIQGNIENYYEFLGFNTQKVSNMGAMFSACEALTSLDLSNFDTSNVDNMSNMFYYCQSLNSLDLSSFNTSEVYYMNEMFCHCHKLISLILSNNFITSNVTEMTSMFEYCTSLTSLNLFSFDISNANMDRMFYYCSANIPVLYLDAVHDGINIFTGSTGKIYLVRRNPEEDENNDNVIRNDWRNYIAQNNYTNVFLEYDSSTRPTASLVLNRGKFENNKWEADETDGGVIKIELHSNVYNDNQAGDEYLASNSIESVTAAVNKDNYIKNVDYTVNYQAANDLIYLTLLTLPGSQYDITVTITDKSGIPVSFTAIIPGIFAMIEFKAGGHGMSIGKICERDGLEVSIPTTIGKELLLPMDNQNVDLSKNQLAIGRYNIRRDDALFLIGNGDENQRSNILEVYDNNINFNDSNINFNGGDIYFNHLKKYDFTQLSSLTTDNIITEITNLDNSNFYLNNNTGLTSGTASYHVSSGRSLTAFKITLLRSTKIVFQAKVSSESNYDFGAIYIGTQLYRPTVTQIKNGTTDGNGQYVYRKSGNQAWEEVSIDLESGQYYIIFVYAKDSSNNTNDDRFYIKDMSIEKSVDIYNSIIYPINSVITTSTPNPPASYGEWQLLHKTFAPTTWQDSTGAGLTDIWTWNDTNTQNSANTDYKRDVVIRRTTEGIQIRLRWYNKTAFVDDTTSGYYYIGALKLSAIGINGYLAPYMTAQSDGLNAVISMNMLNGRDELGNTTSDSAAFHAIDVVNRGSSTLPTSTNQAVGLLFELPITQVQMLDSACDTFTWKRIS